MADTDTAGTVECEVQAGASDAEGCGMDASDDFEVFERTAALELGAHGMVTIKKRQLKCDLGDLGDVSAPARRLSWNFDLTARLKPRHSSCLCRYQEPCES